jgi:flap endonuclease-1
MSHVNELTDADGNTTAHVNTILAKILQLDKAGISQIWVFDSPKPNPLKAAELADRDRKAYNSNDPKVQFRMKSKHVNDIKKLLTLMGIPWVEAPEGIEAEQYGAWMTRGEVPASRFCQYMISGDSDVLAFGGNLLRPYSKLSATGKSKKTSYQVFELSDILQETGLSYDSFLEMAVTMGTDFCSKTPMIGVKTVIQKIKDEAVKFTPQQRKVIEYFKSRPPRSEQDAHFSEYNKTELIDFLVSLKFNEEKVKERIKDFPKIVNM